MAIVMLLFHCCNFQSVNNSRGRLAEPGLVLLTLRYLADEIWGLPHAPERYIGSM